MSDGLLLVDKGSGVSSFQVVAHVRRVLREAKVGHGGTLDPLATGILPLPLGAATKLTPYLQAQDKEYVAVIRLGVTTDTLDAAGRVTGERPVPALERVRLESVLGRFVGEIDQVPPMFSALHAGGRRLHELARAGVEVERAPRRVRIDAIDLLDWVSPCLTVRVACGKGTYVRSLAADIGATLGCGARLDALTRTRLGRFSLEAAVPWPVVREGNIAALRAALLPPDRAVDHLPARTVSELAAQRLAHGQPLRTGEVDPAPGVGGEGLCRLYAGARFLGIGQAGPSGVRALRILHADHPRPRPVPR